MGRASAPPASTDTPAENAGYTFPSRGEARRQAMLQAAGELFLEHGFEGTSVSDVVKRSGGSLATLYAWFGSKEGLFEAIVTDLSSGIVSAFDAPDFEASPPEEALQTFGEKFLGMILCPEALRWHRMCIAESHKFPELRALLLRTGPAIVQERVARYLVAQTQAGRLQVADPRVAALHYFSLIKSETHLAAVCGEPIEASPADIEQQVRRAVQVFLRGYAAPGRKPTAESSSPPPRLRRERGTLRGLQ